MSSVALVDDGVVTELSSWAQCGVFPGFGTALENRRTELLVEQQYDEQ